MFALPADQHLNHSPRQNRKHRRVVGWQLASHMRTDLVLDALRMALGTREHGADLALVHHHAFGRCIANCRLTTVGDAYDNALAESFVDSFKTELIADRVWRSRAQLELGVVEYIGWFNTARLHSSLGYRAPVEVEADRAESQLVKTAPRVRPRQTLAAGLSDQ